MGKTIKIVLALGFGAAAGAAALTVFAHRKLNQFIEDPSDGAQDVAAVLNPVVQVTKPAYESVFGDNH